MLADDAPALAATRPARRWSASARASTEPTPLESWARLLFGDAEADAGV